MGRTLATATQIIHNERDAFSKFRGALRRRDQLALDELFANAQNHSAEISFASHSLPFETMLLTMLLEQHKEVMQLRGVIEALSLVIQDLYRMEETKDN